MNPDTPEYRARVEAAHKMGLVIEITARSIRGVWDKTSEPGWHWGACLYRISPAAEKTLAELEQLRRRVAELESEKAQPAEPAVDLSTMQIGQYARTRGGQHVSLTQRSNQNMFPFSFSDHHTRTLDGNYSSFYRRIPHPRDIVEIMPLGWKPEQSEPAKPKQKRRVPLTADDVRYSDEFRDWFGNVWLVEEIRRNGITLAHRRLRQEFTYDELLRSTDCTRRPATANEWTPCYKEVEE